MKEGFLRRAKLMQPQGSAAKRAKWQARLDYAKRSYDPLRQKMDRRQAYYTGDHSIPAASGASKAKDATNVRNIVYELIESQVDSTVPQPRVTAIHPEDKELARKIEALLLNQIRLLNFKELNDLQERTVPIQGGDYWQVEWDPNAGFHCTLGDLSVCERHPKQVIPQPGVYDVEKMEYIFVLVSQSREYLERRYGVKIEEESESDVSARTADGEYVEGLVTQNIVYFRNREGGIGLFSWVGDQTLEDLEDYQARRGEVCCECGTRRTAAACPVCGSKKFRQAPLEAQELERDITLADGTLVPALEPGEPEPVKNPDGSIQTDLLTGEPIWQEGPPVRTTIPYYKPNAFPLVLRRNVRLFGQLLGSSDVDVIEDQQIAVSKFGTKIEEKLLKGGSYVTLPEGVNVETTDRELKVLRMRNPADKSMIGVVNVQVDTSRDQNMLETNYAWAKSTLGITDAFQGKYDASATSGTAKQFSANQSAGRLQSKREMKNQAYAKLYKLMFQFMLAYADEPYPLTYQQPDGQQQFTHFDRYDFLKQDAAGEFYWCDEFIFEVDPASNLASNRETLWSMIDVKYQAGAFGPINELQSQYRLWTLLAETGYPHAEAMKASIKQEIDEQKAAALQAAGVQPGLTGQAAAADTGHLEGGL